MTSFKTVYHSCWTSAVLLGAFALLTAGCGTATTAEGRNADRNADALRTAQQNIETFRKGDVQIKVVDLHGQPIANKRITVKQLSHDFKFGCYLKVDDLEQSKLTDYGRLFKQLFNYAVIGTYWRRMEKKQGAPDWTWFDRETALAEKLGSKIEAAPILWGTNEYGVPSWLPRKTDELNTALEQRVRSAIARNTNVADWEVVNEPLSKHPDLFARGAPEDYISSALSWAKTSAPAKRIMINESGVFGASADRSYNKTRYFDLLKTLIANDASLDVIGIQAHAKGEWYEPADVAAELDRYAMLGKPLQISEFSVQTREFNDPEKPLRVAGRDQFWNEERQARFYREFYTICFGNRQVESIVTWGLDDERAWLPGAGLIAADDKPKAAYRELDQMINREWTTDIRSTTDGSGVLEFRGFHGDYEVTVEDPKHGMKEFRFTLSKGDPNKWTARLGT